MEDDEVARLYRMYGPVIYARCRGLLHDEAEAEDATQETFVRVQRHLARAPAGREALYWIYRIATNYCLNELRDRRRRPLPVAVIAEGALGVVGPDQRIADRDLATRLIHAADEKLRAVAWLHHVDGFEWDEVARVLGISRRTVATRLARFLTNARKRLRRTEA